MKRGPIEAVAAGALVLTGCSTEHDLPDKEHGFYVAPVAVTINGETSQDVMLRPLVKVDGSYDCDPDENGSGKLVDPESIDSLNAYNPETGGFMVIDGSVEALPTNAVVDRLGNVATIDSLDCVTFDSFDHSVNGWPVEGRFSDGWKVIGLVADEAEDGMFLSKTSRIHELLD